MTPEHVPGLRAFISVVVGVAVVIGFIVIFQAMYTAVMERTREIGILKSLGANKLYIINVILRETIVLAIFGIIVGIAFSALARVGPERALLVVAPRHPEAWADARRPGRFRGSVVAAREAHASFEDDYVVTELREFIAADKTGTPKPPVAKVIPKDVTVHGDQRVVGDPHPVVDLVALAQAAEDRDRVLDGGLAGARGVERGLQAQVQLRHADARGDGPDERRGAGAEEQDVKAD